MTRTHFLPFFFSATLLMASCQSNKGGSSDSPLTGKWQLVKLESSLPQSAHPDTALPYQETYEFKADHSFRKYRPDGAEAKGTYATKQLEGQEYIEASFAQEEASSGCVAGKAHLQQTGPDTLVEDNLACDGPKLYYQRIKSDK